MKPVPIDVTSDSFVPVVKSGAAVGRFNLFGWWITNTLGEYANFGETLTKLWRKPGRSGTLADRREVTPQ